MNLVDRTMRTAKGNVSQSLRDMMADFWFKNQVVGEGFGRAITAKLEVVEANVYDNNEISGKKEGRVVFETVVSQGEYRLRQVKITDCIA